MIKIPVGNGINIVAEQGTDPNFSNEIYIGLVNDNDMWLQDLAMESSRFLCILTKTMKIILISST